MLSTWITVSLLAIIWLCAFIALVACAPILLTARRERWLRRVRRAFWNACENIWWLGPRPIRIITRRSSHRRPARTNRLSRRRAA